MYPVLTHSQKWELLIATGGADLQHVIIEPGVITQDDNSGRRPTPLDPGIELFRAAIPRIQHDGRTESKGKKENDTE